jgi:hypothetical protein
MDFAVIRKKSVDMPSRYGIIRPIRSKTDMGYSDFLESKTQRLAPSGFSPEPMNPRMRPGQVMVTDQALRAGKFAIFADCGLGKTLDELEFAQQVVRQTNKPVLILAPLCVSIQTKQIGEEFGYDVNICRTDADVCTGINISNYEMLTKFDATRFAGIVLDESSILKNYAGKIRNNIIETFQRTPYKLAATATPAPNDFMELGNHAEFLNVMSRAEMLSMYFVHDGGDVQKWRLKKHAVESFWKWVNTWSATYSRPSELNPSFSDDGFVLPGLRIHPHVITQDAQSHGMLFPAPVNGMMEAKRIKRETVPKRCDYAIDMIGDDPGYWVVWCDLNAEGDYLQRNLGDARQLCGSQSIEEKEEILWAFTKGEIRRLITKQKITSFGLNWQHCHKTIFVGPNYSYESAYQAIKRFHRFGQADDVDAHWIMMESEETVYNNLIRKMEAHGQMKGALLQCAM